jgi:hypothetical protein
MSNETETDLCLTEFQEADMCVVGAAETCEPCIEQGTFMDIYPVALQSSLQDLMTTGGGSDFCTEQEDSMCRYVSLLCKEYRGTTLGWSWISYLPILQRIPVFFRNMDLAAVKKNWFHTRVVYT